MSTSTIRLLINCPDTRGIIAAVANFVAESGGNILDADQHTDPHSGEFFMRIEIDPTGFALTRETFEAAWRPVADKFKMRWQLHWAGELKRMVVLASREEHCLHDLLWRWRTRELRAELPAVISNHEQLRPIVEGCGVKFEHVPNSAESRDDAEARMTAIAAALRADFLVLARYMQVLSQEFVSRWPQSIINIHHSFLPAFAGSRPYHQAFERGVKIIGATSHYVTNDLDAGPIIAQSTIPVDHRDTIDDMIRKGRDLERSVLARAVRLHIEDRILVSNNKTVVFD